VVALDRLVAQLSGGNTVRISIRVAAPSGSKVRTEVKAFGSPRDSPWRSAIRSGGVISVKEIHSG
jgi:hypothetical protein